MNLLAKLRALFRREKLVLGGEGVLPRVHVGAEVTAEVFSLPNVAPLHGRVLDREDNQPGAPRVVVLGWKIWQSEFAGAENVVGRTVRVDGEPGIVIGVMPRGF